MVDLSVKGIARRYRGISSDFSVVRDLLGLSSVEGSISLRSPLESMARHQRASLEYEYCKMTTRYDIWNGTWVNEFVKKYKRPVAYEQTWTHIFVKILLVGVGVSEPLLLSLAAMWKKSIEKFWNNKWGCARAGEGTCRLTFEVQFSVTTYVDLSDFETLVKYHQIVWVGREEQRANQTSWNRWLFDYIRKDKNGKKTVHSTVAHEFGHMIGNADEYYMPNECAGRERENTGTVMDQNAEVIADYMMQRFADNIGSNVVSI